MFAPKAELCGRRSQGAASPVQPVHNLSTVEVRKAEPSVMFSIYHQMEKLHSAKRSRAPASETGTSKNELPCK